MGALERRQPLQRRVPLTATVGSMRRTPVRQVSARRRRRDAGYPSSRRQVYERADGMCEARTPVCVGGGHQVHHIAGRGGPEPHRPDNLKLCCAPCHEWIHANPEESYERGLMSRRNGA